VVHRACQLSEYINRGLINPTCTGIIGSGVVIHIPSFFAELDALQSQGMISSSNLISELNHSQLEQD
jgi:adenylosuccinate synthase